jgi:hypothetical protein
MNAPTRFILGFTVSFLAATLIGNLGGGEPEAVNGVSLLLAISIGIAFAGRYPNEGKRK